MPDSILILNAGSSSLKFSLFADSDPPQLTLHGQIEGLQTAPHFVARDASGSIVGERSWNSGIKLSHDDAVEFLFDWGRQHQTENSRVIAAGHRVVHGGTKFTKPVLVDDGVLDELDSLIPLAPLHQPHNIAGIRAVAKHSPQLPQVACFDTAFHRTQPPVAKQFAIPRNLTAAGIERYGFHGLSYEYIASQLPQFDPRAAAGRTVVAHLGNGASLCALKGGISVATTMGFTPLDGLVMGTRCGSIDPGVLLYLIDERKTAPQALQRLLTNESGLLGVSGISSDMRTLLQREPTDPRAAEAVELFVYRLSRELGSMAAALGGLDALVFTGGIGENAPIIRDRVCRLATWLGIELDPTANQNGSQRISASSSKTSAWVIPTNEELMIARHTRHLLQLSSKSDRK
jgi:acetate kinase